MARGFGRIIDRQDDQDNNIFGNNILGNNILGQIFRSRIWTLPVSALALIGVYRDEIGALFSKKNILCYES